MWSFTQFYLLVGRINRHNASVINLDRSKQESMNVEVQFGAVAISQKL